MRSVVTGCAGFIGSHLCEYLISAGNEVFGIDDLSTGTVDNLKHLRFPWVRGSASESECYEHAVRDCDRVFHLASSVGVKRIIERPIEAVRNIYETTATVLSICDRHQKPVLITSSSEVYGKGNGVPFREDDDVVLGPTNSPRWAYAAAKMADEFLALAYHRERFLPVRIVRLFNTVGRRQTGRYGMVLPTFVAQAKAGRNITVYGDGTQTRCFASVHDVVPAMVAMMETDITAGQVVNIGTDEEVSINDLAVTVVRAVAANCVDIVHRSLNDAYGLDFEDMRRRVPDLSKAKKMIGWCPKYQLADSICELVNGEAGSSCMRSRKSSL